MLAVILLLTVGTRTIIQLGKAVADLVGMSLLFNQVKNALPFVCTLT